jgi:hypothetical protein
MTLDTVSKILSIKQRGSEARLLALKGKGSAHVQAERRDPLAVRYGAPYRSGKVTVYDGMNRSALPCVTCGAYVNTGKITVVHDDGRTASISYAALHDVEARHTVGAHDDLDDIMADA